MFREWVIRLFASDLETHLFNDWRFVAMTTLGFDTLVVLMLVLVAALAIGAFGLARVSRKKRIVLVLLRVLVGVWIMLLVVRPGVELRAVSPVATQVAVLIDTSRSMGLAAGDETRGDWVWDHLGRHEDALEKLRRQASLDFYSFGTTLSPLNGRPTTKWTSSESRTDIAQALQALMKPSGSRQLSAIVLYSDGTDTEGLSLEAAKRLGASSPVPIYSVGFSSENAVADLAVTRVVVDEFAFVHNTVTVDVEIEQRGYDFSSVLVSLKREGHVLESKEARFEGAHARVSFNFKPSQIGKQVYEVSVPVQSEELVPTNNQKNFVLKVIRDRIRVLQVAGRPSWDQRFLREFLKRNPNVDLVSFFILRSTTDLQKASQDELALIPFPVNELFTKELETFDIVIYQNFSYRPYRMARYLENVKNYVLNGGSFLMIGGDTAFEDGWYAQTPLADVLPVRLGGAPAWDRQDYRPRLTDAGRRHPIMRIGEPGEPLDAVYRDLPSLSGFNGSLGLLPDAQSLLVHSALPGNPPVVAIREVNKGRSMAVLTDSLWFWRFLTVKDGGSRRAFERFWNNATRWLIRDPELDRVRLNAQRSVFFVGEPVRADIRVLGSDYRGLQDAEVRAQLRPLEDQGEASHRSEAAKTNDEGRTRVLFSDVSPGVYVLEAQATLDNGLLGRAQEPIIVRAVNRELETPFPRSEVMKALAQSSGGEYSDVAENLPPVKLKRAERVQVDRTRRVPIWNSFPMMLVLLLLGGAEWWMRRRAGVI